MYSTKETEMYFPEMLRWIPKAGEYYWHYKTNSLQSAFKVSRHKWSTWPCIDKFYLKTGNVFKTKKAALNAVKEIEKLTKTIRNI